MNNYGIDIECKYLPHTELFIVDIRQKQIFDFTVEQICTKIYSGMYQQDVLYVEYIGRSSSKPEIKSIALGGMVGEYYKLFETKDEAKYFLIDLL